MSVYLFPSVCAWSVCARVLQWNGVCAFRRMCECECDMSILLVSLLHVAVRWLAGWPDRRWPTNLARKCDCLDTNLVPIYGSTAAEWTNTHTHAHTHRGALGTPPVYVWLAALCLCVCSPTGSPTTLCHLFIYFFQCEKSIFFLIQTLLRSPVIYSKGLGCLPLLRIGFIYVCLSKLTPVTPVPEYNACQFKLVLVFCCSLKSQSK